MTGTLRLALQRGASTESPTCSEHAAETFSPSCWNPESSPLQNSCLYRCEAGDEKSVKTTRVVMTGKGLAALRALTV